MVNITTIITYRRPISKIAYFFVRTHNRNFDGMYKYRFQNENVLL
eukprot:UN10052